MTSTPEISIIIVNYNTHRYLRKLLSSIMEFLGNQNIETIVADNNSDDRSIEEFADEFPGVKFILRNVNDGFGGGCNHAAELSQGKYLLFLNPDIILFDDSVLKLKLFLEKNEDAGIVSGVMLNNDNSVIYFYNEFPSVSWEFYLMIGYGYEQKISRLINRKEIRENQIFEVDWFHGAFFMIRKSDFDFIKGFDENYFMYLEDIDICFRVRKILNKSNYCIPEVKVYHHTQSSIKTETNDNIYFFHMQRGKLLFLRNYGFFKKSVIYSIGLSSIILRIAALPFWGKYSGSRKEKFHQLSKVLKLFLNKDYLYSSKFIYVKNIE